MRSANQLKNLKPAKPGNNMNPRGSRAHDPLLKALRKLTVKEYAEAIQRAMTCTLPELQALIQDKTITAIQLGVATAMAKAIKEGNISVIETLAARIMGKIPDQLVVTDVIKVTVSFDDKNRLRRTMAQIENDI